MDLATSRPQLIFGGASIGESFKDVDAVDALLGVLAESSIERIDTAARYPPTAPGMSQRLLGESGAGGKGFSIDTKILTSPATVGGSLSAPAIEKSLDNSLKHLGVSKVHILYCHFPDNVTPLAEQAAAFDKQYKLGKFEKLGVSNFKPEMIEAWVNLADEKGYIKPSVYQGQYNLFCRKYEKSLFPTLRAYGITFAAFGPLAGGFLTGKFRPEVKPEDLVGTRLEAGNPFGDNTKRWYDKPSMHEGIRKMQGISESTKISMAELSIRWLVYHSALGGADAVLLGASRLAQVQTNTEQIAHGPLAQDVADQLTGLWDLIEEEAQDIV